MAINEMIALQGQVGNPLNALAQGYKLGEFISDRPVRADLNTIKVDQGRANVGLTKAQTDLIKMQREKLAKDSNIRAAAMGAMELSSTPFEQWGGVLQLRMAEGARYGYNADAEREALDMLQTNPEGLKQQVAGLARFGQQLFGKSQASRSVALNPGGQLYGPDGTLLAENQNVRQTAQQQQTPSAVAEWQFYNKLPPDQRAQYDAMKRGTPGYSSTTEKQIYGASDAYVDDNAAFENYSDLAKRYEQAQGKLVSGAAGTLTEWFKEQTGSQDELTALRKDWSKIKASELVNNLPPGAASDSDIMLAKEGFLPTNANPQTVASFLRGMAKLRKLNAEYNAFKADYLSENKNPGGMRKAWQDRAAQMGVGGPTNSASQSGGLQPGAVEDGYRFKGGNPADPNNWEAM